MLVDFIVKMPISNIKQDYSVPFFLFPIVVDMSIVVYRCFLKFFTIHCISVPVLCFYLYGDSPYVPVPSFYRKFSSSLALYSGSESEKIRIFWLDPNQKKSLDLNSDPDTVVK
jgi:hypothetical protein